MPVSSRECATGMETKLNPNHTHIASVEGVSLKFRVPSLAVHEVGVKPKGSRYRYTGPAAFLFFLSLRAEEEHAGQGLQKSVQL